MQFDDAQVRSYMKDYRQACGRRLQDWRKIRNLQQRDLAEAGDVTQQMISFAELGMRTPKLEARMKICAALSVEHDDIWPAPNRIHFAQKTVAA
jgi:transcriptional regulator with XRE-family HTH domain